MDELIKLVTKKAGISEDQAKQAVNAVVGYLKKNLPAPIASQIDGLLSSGDLVKGAGAVSGMLGGVLGKKK
jgi:hypothetical protein